MSGKNLFSRNGSRLAKTAVLALALVALPGMQSRMGNYEHRLLYAHNEERALLELPPLKWDKELARNAKAYAEVLAQSGRFEHSPNKPGQPMQGENLWRGTAGAFGPELMLRLWIAEKQHFVPGQFPYTTQTGNVGDVSHYTQMIWRDTDRVGCGVARGAVKEVLVCRYTKPGNIIGQDVF